MVAAYKDSRRVSDASDPFRFFPIFAFMLKCFRLVFEPSRVLLISLGGFLRSWGRNGGDRGVKIGKRRYYMVFLFGQV